MEYVSETRQNPFALRPPCEQYVPGYGDVDADVHVIGDHPGVHGGLGTGVPFTGMPWSPRFFETLRTGGLAAETTTGVPTFLSYLHLCVPETPVPSAAAYDRLEPFFDAELRAITAHILVPVGDRPVRHVLRTYTSMSASRLADGDATALHASPQRGAGWLILPVRDPSEWTKDDETTLVETLQSLLAQDYRQESDLGRFLPDEHPYFVR